NYTIGNDNVLTEPLSEIKTAGLMYKMGVQ
nr:RecName: Full=Inorganic pyrophosphatase; AltName: Full=Pyrophosphate phospho-hydrolase; Short=PPase [Nitratidesulfovibrio vulgaris str. Hildenborough]